MGRFLSDPVRSRSSLTGESRRSFTPGGERPHPRCRRRTVDLPGKESGRETAHHNDKILKKHGIQPLVRTRKLAAEELTKAFPVNTYDLVFARNCIGHSYNPERAILEMINVVKRGRYVLLEHLPNEGKSENYQGLHQ